MTPAEGRKDAFVSYTGVDRRWAEWIAWVLEEAGHTVALQAWDFRPGSNLSWRCNKPRSRRSARSPYSRRTSWHPGSLLRNGQRRLGLQRVC